MSSLLGSGPLLVPQSLCAVLQVLDNAIETEKMIEKYESLASDLLEWIEQTIIILNNRKFANSLVGVQQQLQAFNTYRTVEKPPKSVKPHVRLRM